jgi:hypothetical protein
LKSDLRACVGIVAKLTFSLPLVGCASDNPDEGSAVKGTQSALGAAQSQAPDHSLRAAQAPIQTPNIRKAPPAPQGQGLRHHPLAAVVSIVEAEIKRQWVGFDERLGPRTYYELSDVVVHAGRRPGKRVFSQLGGVLPDGSELVVEHLPQFSTGARYLLFFAKQASVYTAVWADLAFRVEDVGPRKVVVGPHGSVVLGLGVEGVKFGRTSFVERNVEAPHTSPGPFNRALATSDAEVGEAPSVATVVENAIAASRLVGAALGESYDIEPSVEERWDVSPTTPSAEGT